MARTVTVDLEDSALEALDRIAELTERTRAEIISDAVQDYLELQAWQLEKIEAGLAAADRGDFADDGEIARIAEKYSRPA